MGSPLGPTLANMLFLYILKRIGYKIVHLTLSLTTTGGTLMVSLFCSPQHNIWKPSKIL